MWARARGPDGCNLKRERASGQGVTWSLAVTSTSSCRPPPCELKSSALESGPASHSPGPAHQRSS
eukprot:1590857-Rhodomonas_salina.2